MYCPACGQPGDTDVLFCAECGTSLPQVVEPRVIAGLYHVVLLSWKGQTVGKALVGVTVNGPDHRPPTLLRAALRETVGKAVSSIFCIGFLWIVFNERKRGLHDLIAGTELVRVAVGFRRWRRSWRTAGEEVGH